MQDYNGYTPLFLSVIDYTTPEMLHLLSTGANPNISTRAGEPLLHYAAAFTRCGSVDLSLRRSPYVAVNSRDNTESIPLYKNAPSGRVGVFMPLENTGTNTGLVNIVGASIGKGVTYLAPMSWYLYSSRASLHQNYPLELASSCGHLGFLFPFPFLSFTLNLNSNIFSLLTIDSLLASGDISNKSWWWQ